MASGALVWWRIEIGANGKASDIRAVDHPEKDGVQVFYVKARDQKAAAHLVHNAYCAARLRKKRADWLAAGLCTKCGRPPKPGNKRCAACLESKSEEATRRYARKRGEVVPVPTRIEALERKRTELRLAVLREAHARFRASKSPWEFLDWLKKQIEALAGRKVA